MSDGTILGTLFAVLGGFVAIVFFAARTVAATHDPARSAHAADVERDGSFVLDVPISRGDPLFFKFELEEPNTDGDYDLLITGEVEAAGGQVVPFAWKTKERSTLEGANAARNVGSIFATTMVSGSIELVLALPRGQVTIRGRVSQGEGTVLRRSSVYLPS